MDVFFETSKPLFYYVEKVSPGYTLYVSTNKNSLKDKTHRYHHFWLGCLFLIHSSARS